jgi:hypothetical protein
MKSMLLVGLLALSSVATASSESDLQDLARDAGLTDREMRMLMGASSGYAEYRTSYAQIRAKLRRAEAAMYRDEELAPPSPPRASRAMPASTSERTAPAEAETYPLDEPQ